MPVPGKAGCAGKSRCELLNDKWINRELARMKTLQELPGVGSPIIQAPI